MKTVRLPIFDEKGYQTREYLEVNVELFKRIANYTIATQNDVKVLEKPKSDTLKKISERMAEDEARAKSFEKGVGVRPYPLIPDPVREAIEMDFIERTMCGLPTEEIRETLGAGVWRTIENFSGYRMNPNKMIIDKETQKTVEQKVHNKGRAVMLFDGRAGRLKTMDVDFLFQKTFPEFVDKWVTIKRYSLYEINDRTHQIRNKETRVPVEVGHDPTGKTRNRFVEIQINKEGQYEYISIDWIIANTL